MSGKKSVFVSLAVLAVGLALGYGLYTPSAPAARPRVPFASPPPLTPAAAVVAPSLAAVAAPPLAVPQAEYSPRPASEWQGMRVSREIRQTCETSEQCGLALACHEDKLCGPCRDDADCPSGEACAIDHCVVREKLACRRTADCPSGEACMLSGLTSDPRGNAGMRAFCAGRSGYIAPEPEVEVTFRPAPPPPVPMRELVDSLRQED